MEALGRWFLFVFDVCSAYFLGAIGALIRGIQGGTLVLSVCVLCLLNRVF